jgi:glycosyltransferase involved in cell wall biosynthesis
MLDLLDRFPGVVVLHDFHLSELLQWAEASGAVPELSRRVLYRCHGYGALTALRDEGTEKAIMAYPANKQVLDRATGVIVHSPLAIQSAQNWYSPDYPQDWQTVPPSRALPFPLRRDDARRDLAIAASDFVVCSFGIVHPTKWNHRLLDAFLCSDMAHDPRCHLIFVGDASEPPSYRQSMMERIAASPARDRVRITGFVPESAYRFYLTAADVAVQLRARSQGESSRGALDAMAHGLPLIVNTCGTMAELPADCVMKLPAMFGDDDLVRALERLWRDERERKRMSALAQQHIRTHHHPAVVAEQYREAIEFCSTGTDQARYRRLVHKLADDQTSVEPSDGDLASVAACIAANMPALGRRQLLLDISGVVAQATAASDLPPALSDILGHLPDIELLGFRVEPIRWDTHCYRYATAFTCRWLAVESANLADEVVDVGPRDVILAGSGGEIDPAALADLSRFQRAGTTVHAMADRVPLEEAASGAASGRLQSLLAFADGIICSSRVVAMEFEQWLVKNPPARADTVSLGWLALEREGTAAEYHSEPIAGVPWRWLTRS